MPWSLKRLNVVRLSDTEGVAEDAAGVVCASAAGGLPADGCPDNVTFALAVAALSAALIEAMLAACASCDTAQLTMGNQVADQDDTATGDAATKMSRDMASSMSSCRTFDVRVMVELTSQPRVGATPARACTVQ
jgi:hypothetical protein